MTAEELKQFTYVNMGAFDLARQQAKVNSKKIPAWLCTSEEVRQEYRKKFIEWLNKLVQPFVPFDPNHPEIVETYLAKHTNTAHLVQLWIKMETTLKEEREKGNPTAFFV